MCACAFEFRTSVTKRNDNLAAATYALVDEVCAVGGGGGGGGGGEGMADAAVAFIILSFIVLVTVMCMADRGIKIHHSPPERPRYVRCFCSPPQSTIATRLLPRDKRLPWCFQIGEVRFFDSNESPWRLKTPVKNKTKFSESSSN